MVNYGSAVQEAGSKSIESGNRKGWGGFGEPMNEVPVPGSQTQPGVG